MDKRLNLKEKQATACGESLSYRHPELVEGARQINKAEMFRLRST